jgi:hypothetical protein
MRDWHSGAKWDNRTIRELHYCRLRVVCKFCQHNADFDPAQLVGRQPGCWNWQLIIPRFKCSICHRRDADARTEPLPRN